MQSGQCWVCRRITPQLVLKLAHKVFAPEVARQVGLEACKIIKESYAEKPTFFCGCPAKTILGGLFYLLSFKHDIPLKSQREIAEALSINEVTIRNRYREWSKEFPEVASPLNKARRRKKAKQIAREKLILEEIKANGKLYPCKATFLPQQRVYQICERLNRRGVLLRRQNGQVCYLLNREDG